MFENRVEMNSVVLLRVVHLPWKAVMEMSNASRSPFVRRKWGMACIKK